MILITLEAVRAALLKEPQRPFTPSGTERHAAVATILRSGALGAEALLIRRAEHERDPWSGHMAFPGGRHDPGDSDLLHTAQRETAEEVGVDLTRHAELLGRLEDVPAIARGKRVGLTIVPFVFALNAPVELTPNHEVAEVLWVPLSKLANGDLSTTTRYRLQDQTLELPAWDVEGRIVWGLTYRMLRILLERLGWT